MSLNRSSYLIVEINYRVQWKTDTDSFVPLAATLFKRCFLFSNCFQKLEKSEVEKIAKNFWKFFAMNKSD